MPFPALLALAGLATGGYAVSSANKSARKIGKLRFPSALSSDLGLDAASFLRQRLNTPASETSLFTNLSGRLRGDLRRQFRAAERQLLESGRSGRRGAGVAGAIAELRRGEGEATALGISDLLAKLEQLRDQGVFEFLDLGVREGLGRSGLRLQQAGTAANIRQQGTAQLLQGISMIPA